MDIEKCLKLAKVRGLISLPHSLPPLPSGEVLPLSYDNHGTLEIAADAPMGWDILAGWLSAACHLTAWAGGSGVTLVSGNRVYCRIISSSVWSASWQARIVAEKVTGEVMPTSQGAIARKLWERVGPPQYTNEGQLSIIQAPGTFYTKAIPGLYRQVWQYDLSNAYGSIIAKFPTPYLYAKKNGEVKFRHKVKLRGEWHELDFDKWYQLQECSRTCKYIGRALYGAALGSDKKQRRWEKGDKMMHPLAQGGFRNLGTLTARVIHEVTYLASQSENVVHSYTDCVATTEGVGVPVWDSLDMPYKEKNCGEADIINTVAYRVGRFVTSPYASAKGLPAAKPCSEFETAVRMVRGDNTLPQLFSTCILMKEGR